MNEPILLQIVPITNKKIKDMTGQKFNRLFVIGYVGTKVIGKDHQKRSQWLCRCDCGNHTVVVGHDLRDGSTKSCGCYCADRASAANKATKTTHGKSHSTEYTIWRGMLDRCRNPRNQQYRWYGERGIKVSERWHKFENFYADMGKRPSVEYTIDRIDNDMGYSADNCRWATEIEQKNNRSDNRLVCFRDETHTLAEWSRITGIKYTVLKSRFRCGWDAERALTTPIQKYTRTSKEESGT